MIVGVVGLAGSGKSLSLAYDCSRVLRGKRSLLTGKKYSKVFTNFELSGCYKFDWDDLGKINVENSIIFVDEISMFADSRNFKNFSTVEKFFFSQHRKFRCDFVYCSQDFFDVEKRIRENTHKLYYVSDFVLGFSSIRPIIPFFDVSIVSHSYTFDKFINSKFFYRPSAYKLIDSYSFIKKPVEIVEKSVEMWK